MRILELFAGIGACSKALKRIGIDIEIVDAVEIDKYAIASFNAIHGTNFETQDITEWNKDLKDIDLITHGSPCQDFSVAGKQAGGDLGSGTRSSLMYETIRIVGQIRPKYVLWENVKNILSKKHKHNFDAYIETMNVLGYSSYYQILNAKDYGIPQNRERVYTISIRKDILVYDDYNSSIRKDQDTIGTLTTNCGANALRNGWKIIEYNKPFKFPEKEELNLRLKDMLENEVEEKYYLNEKMQNYILDFNNKQKGTAWEGRANKETLNTNIAHTIGVRSAGGNQRVGVSNFVIDGYDEEIKVKDLKIKIKNATKKGYDEATEGDSINLSYPESRTRRGRVGHELSQTLQCNDSMGVVVGSTQKHAAVSRDGIVPTLTSAMGLGGGHIPMHNYDYKIRKLTPKECWRLMGFDDEDFEKAASVPTSNAQLYKQAGNSIVVNVLEKIFKNLFWEEER